MSTPHSSYLWTGFLAIIFLSGCALRQDVYSLDHRLAAMERYSVELEKQNQELKRQIEAVITPGGSNGSSQLIDERQRYAELAARIQSYEDQMRSISGHLDEVTHQLSQKQSGDGSGQPSPQDRMGKVEASLAMLQKRVEVVEQKLNVPKTKSASPQKTVSADTAAPSETDATLYNAAKKQFDAGALPTARKGFETLLSRYPKSSFSNNAQFWIAETYYQEKWYEKAILEYQKVIENYPSGSKRPAALLKQALAFLNINETGNARLILKELVAQYPSTPEAATAKQKLESLK